MRPTIRASVRFIIRLAATAAAALTALGPAVPATALDLPPGGGPFRLPENAFVARFSKDGSLEQSADGGITWAQVSGLPARVLPAYRAGETLPVTAFAVGEAGPADIVDRAVIAASPGVKQRGYRLLREDTPALAAIGGRLFVSSGSLESWAEIGLEGTISPAAYITAAAIDPDDHDHWLIGTSYDGMYRTTDGGATWTDLTARPDEWPIYVGAGFFEEITEIWFTAADFVLIQAGFGQGFYRVELEPLRVRRLKPLADGEESYGVLEYALWAQRPTANAPAAHAGSGNPAPVDAAAERRRRAADRTGIYLAPQNAMTDRLDAYFDYLDRHGFNSVVVDFKDDFGRLTYASTLEKPRAAGAVTPIIDPPALVAAAHARDIYVIARLVVFQDSRLYAYDNHRYALWDGVTDRPWGVFRTHRDEESGEDHTVQVEFWVDPSSPEVWDYNVEIAREIAAFGVDEIQFDYIRFPSDGDVANIRSRFAIPGSDRVQALEGFLSHARSAIDIPIGVDLFGFNAWSRMDYLGQDMTRLARYVDVVSPMFYPSHFAMSFLPQFSYLDRARVIYDLGTRRSQELGGTDTLIRPYLQAFLIGRELEFELETYRRYLDVQAEGSLAANASGYTLWNASGRYYMLP